MVRRLIELIRAGLFSLIMMGEGDRGCPSRVKKIIRVLYTAVMDVAIRVMVRAQALV